MPSSFAFKISLRHYLMAAGGTGHDSRISDTENTRMAKSLRSGTIHSSLHQNGLADGAKSPGERHR